MATKKKTEADSKGKLKFNSPLDMQEHAVDKAPESARQAPDDDEVNGRWRSMMESGTTEAEYQYQEPVDPVEREYPGLHQDIPKILKAVLRELIIARCGR